MPALIALDSRHRFDEARTNGTRTLPLEDFYLGYRETALEPGEFVVRGTDPDRRRASFGVTRSRRRFDQDISAVLGAFALTLSEEGQRRKNPASGSAAWPRCRSAQIETERAILGKAWNAATARSRASGVCSASFHADFRHAGIGGLSSDGRAAICWKSSSSKRQSRRQRRAFSPRHKECRAEQSRPGIFTPSSYRWCALAPRRRLWSFCLR